MQLQQPSIPFGLMTNFGRPKISAIIAIIHVVIQWVRKQPGWLKLIAILTHASMHTIQMLAWPFFRSSVRWMHWLMDVARFDCFDNIFTFGWFFIATVFAISNHPAPFIWPIAYCTFCHTRLNGSYQHTGILLPVHTFPSSFIPTRMYRCWHFRLAFAHILLHQKPENKNIYIYIYVSLDRGVDRQPTEEIATAKEWFHAWRAPPKFQYIDKGSFSIREIGISTQHFWSASGASSARRMLCANE